MLSDADELAPR